MIRSAWVEKDIYKTLATEFAEEIYQTVDIKCHPVHHTAVMMWAAWAQESIQAPEDVQRYMTGADIWQASH